MRAKTPSNACNDAAFQPVPVDVLRIADGAQIPGRRSSNLYQSLSFTVTGKELVSLEPRSTTTLNPDGVKKLAGSEGQ